MAGRPQVLRLYKQMLRSARGFDNYNFRDYTLRYVRDDFRAHRGADAAAAAELYAKGLEQHAIGDRLDALPGREPRDWRPSRRRTYLRGGRDASQKHAMGAGAAGAAARRRADGRRVRPRFL